MHKHPSEDPPVWGSAVMCLATTAKIFLSGASIILSGNDAESFIVYAISNPDPETDFSTINWIAEAAVNPTIQVDK